MNLLPLKISSARTPATGSLLYLTLPLVFLFIFFASGATAQKRKIHPDTIMKKVANIRGFLLHQDQDTNYIENHSDRWTLKLIGVTKFNYFRTRDNINNTGIRYRVDRRLNLGVGVSYRWFALDVTFNVGIREDSGFENGKFLDFQGTMYSSRQFITASYQYYYGHKLQNVNGVPSNLFPLTPVRSDIRTLYFGLQYFFAFNYSKFSLKAPFIQNEIQKKSAGSFIFGAGFSTFILDSDSSILPVEMENFFDEKMRLTSLSASSLSISGGYMYTLIIRKHFYVTVSLIPALGMNLGDYAIMYRDRFKSHLSFGLGTLNAIGYNSHKFFGGLSFTADMYRIRIDKQLGLINGRGKAKLFFGYRF